MTYQLVYAKRGNLIRKRYTNLVMLARHYRRVRHLTAATWKVA